MSVHIRPAITLVTSEIYSSYIQKIFLVNFKRYILPYISSTTFINNDSPLKSGNIHAGALF